jgi:hypothetical protein
MKWYVRFGGEFAVFGGIMTIASLGVCEWGDMLIDPDFEMRSVFLLVPLRNITTSQCSIAASPPFSPLSLPPPTSHISCISNTIVQ